MPTHCIRSLTCGGLLALMFGCAPAMPPPQLTPGPAPAARSEFDSVWIAGFVVAGRTDLDLNERTVKRLRFGVSRLASAPMVEEPAIPLLDEPAVLRHDMLPTVQARHRAPLVVSGTVSFTYPIAARPAGPRRRDDHEAVTLQMRLVFIDGVSGQVIAAKTYRKQGLRIGHGQPTVYEAFSELFQRVAPEIQRDIVGGPGPVRWTVGLNRR